MLQLFFKNQKKTTFYFYTLPRTWESLWALQAPVFGTDQQTSVFSFYTIPFSSPHPHPERLCFSREFRVLQQFHGFSSTDYSHPAQWLVGANSLRLCTQMGAWPCDSFHMLHRSFVFVGFLSNSPLYSFVFLFNTTSYSRIGKSTHILSRAGVNLCWNTECVAYCSLSAFFHPFKMNAPNIF